jgi:hypothetical protein
MKIVPPILNGIFYSLQKVKKSKPKLVYGGDHLDNRISTATEHGKQLQEIAKSFLPSSKISTPDRLPATIDEH